MQQPFPLAPLESPDAEAAHDNAPHLNGAASERPARRETPRETSHEAGRQTGPGVRWRWWRARLSARWREVNAIVGGGLRATAALPASGVAGVVHGARRIAGMSPVPLAPAPEAARANAWGEAENPLEAREAELIVALFRTLVLVCVLAGPRLLGIPVTYGLGEVWLAAVAGIYNIVTALGCLLPSRYGLRRPFIVAMDLLLITLWIQLSGHWELRQFYIVVVVVAALWFRVFGGVLAAAVSNFFFLFIWLRAAGNTLGTPPALISASLALDVAMLFLVGCLVGYIGESQERERERRLEDQLLIANYQREIDLSTQLQPSLIAPQWLESGPHAGEDDLTAASGAVASHTIGQTLPGEARLEVGAAMQSARALGGGDYFDLIPLGDGRTGICIADVSGKSVRAQARLPLLKYSLRALAPLYAQPEKLVERLNATLSPDLQPELYIAFCYVVLDPRAGVLSWCNAGHIAPLLIQNAPEKPGAEGVGDAPRITRLKTHGPALGMFADTEYNCGISVPCEMPWRVGDELLLYTDGLTDALSFRGSEDGEAQLKKLAARGHGQPERAVRDMAQELVTLAAAVLDDASPLERAQAVLSQLPRPAGKFEDAESLHRDDITLVVARFV